VHRAACRATLRRSDIASLSGREGASAEPLCSCGLGAVWPLGRSADCRGVETQLKGWSGSVAARRSAIGSGFMRR